MEFRGRVASESHEGGLLLSFRGTAPHLGTALQTVDGTYLGRVDSVIGTVDDAHVHLHPIARELVFDSVKNSVATIQQRRERSG